jgi:hypothetical protein
VSRVQSQGQKFFDHSTCTADIQHYFFFTRPSWKGQKKKKNPTNFHFSQPRISKTLSLLLWSIWANPDSATVDYHNMGFKYYIKETLHTHTRLSKCWNVQIGIVQHLFFLQLIKYFSTICCRISFVGGVSVVGVPWVHCRRKHNVWIVHHHDFLHTKEPQSVCHIGMPEKDLASFFFFPSPPPKFMR